MQSRLIFLSFSFFLLNTAFSQSTDSLKVLAKEAAGETKLKHYQKIALRYYGKEQYDSAAKYFDLMAEYALKVGELEMAGQGFNNVGGISSTLGNFKGAINSYERSIETFIANGDSVSLAVAYTNLGLAYKGMNVYERAFENLFDAARTFESLDSLRYLASSYSAIGNIHRDLGDEQRSHDYLIKSLQLRKEISDTSGIAASLHNLGIWSFEFGNTAEAIELLNEALLFKEWSGSRLPLASTLAQLGDIYLSLDNPEQAKRYYLESLSIRKEFDDVDGIATVSNQLARLSFGLEDYSQALNLAKDALDNSSAGSFMEEQANALTLLKELYTQSKDYQKAVEASTELLRVKESILNQEKARSLMELEVKFEVYQKDREIASQKFEVSSLTAKSHRLLWMASTLGLIVAIIGLLLILTRKVAKERRLAKERVERLLSELNHRTKNHLQTQSALIRQQMLKLKDEPTKDLIKDIDNQIRAINLIHQSLYTSTEDSLERINLSSYIQNIVENLMISFGMTRNQIKLDLNLDDVDIDVHKALPVGLILNESVTNAFKHGFTNSLNKKLSVHLYRGTDKEIILTIADNGEGFDARSINTERGGLKIMKSLTEDLRGKIQFLKKGGGSVRLEF